MKNDDAMMINGPAVSEPPSFQLRIKRVTQRLVKEKDPVLCRQLFQRLMNLKKQQGECKTGQNAKGAAVSKLPCLQLRLKRVIERLSNEKDPVKCEDLKKRKVKLESKIAAKENGAASATLTLAQRVERVEKRLAKVDEDDTEKRNNLQKRLASLKKKLGQKSKPSIPINPQKRFDRIQARLNDENITDKQRENLGQRLEVLRKKLENAGKKTPEASLHQRLARQQRLLSKKDLNPARRQEVERRVARLTDQLENHNHRAVHVRELNKKRLIAAVQRAGGNDLKLARLALQQVYVAHYPIDEEVYIPINSNQIKKKAAIREKALERARSEPCVEWIAAEQYERLPPFWSFDQEKAAFGTKGGHGEGRGAHGGFGGRGNCGTRNDVEESTRNS